jgi:tetratricopeptide (TPR) repeat protein
MKKVLLLVIALAAMTTASAGAEDPRHDPPPLFSLGVWPVVPVGSILSADFDFGLNTGVRLGAEYVLPFFPWLFAAGGLEYGYSSAVSYYGTPLSISLLTGTLGLGLRLPIAEWLTLRVLAQGGYYYGFLNQTGVTDGSGNPYFSAGLGLAFNAGRLFTFEIASGYYVRANLQQNLQVSLGAIYNIYPAGEVQITDLAFESVFPVFRTFYDTHAIGKATIRNTATSPATGIRVYLNIPQFMDAPKECITLSELKPGAQQSVDVYALFTPGILDTIQDTKAAAELTVTCTIAGKTSTVTRTQTVTVYHKNAMTWDPDAKAAAFVTYMDPAVLAFSNNVNAAVRSTMNPAIDRNLQTAIALHDALRLIGISYVSPPLTSYEVTSRDKLAVDTLKFPRETFAYRSGDCSDLSILYSALLESVQVETAFLTIPGHIFMAFALNATEEEARRTVADPDSLIWRDGKAWVPVEVTERERTFLDAWEEGAREWKESAAKGQAGFDRVREAWKTYPAVDLSSMSSPPALPETAALRADFLGDVQRHIRLQVASQVPALQADVDRTGGSARTLNALGVLYARYGLGAEAEARFKAALAREEYVPALVNLGSLSLRTADWAMARSYYERALRGAPKYPGALLGMARVAREQEDYDTMAAMYARLQESSAELARQFSWLGLMGASSTRAADAATAGEMMVWDE